MNNFIKVKKLNLVKNVLNSEFGKFATMFGADKEALEKIPEEEIVLINPDKIIGISEKMKTGLKDDDRLCCKVYFSKDDYWAIKWDEELEEILKTLL